MTNPSHVERLRRTALARVERELLVAGHDLRWGYEPVERYVSLAGGPPHPVTALVVTSPTLLGRAQVVVVAVRRVLPPGEGGLGADRRTWVGDVDLDYSLCRRSALRQYRTRCLLGHRTAFAERAGAA